MSFQLLEEWPDEKKPGEHRNMPLAGTFATREEADEEKKRRIPLHPDGYIKVVEEKLPDAVRRVKRQHDGRNHRR
jgi:hypothetical protein